MLEQAWRHWATATDLAAALVRERDLPWRTAHQIVGISQRQARLFEEGLRADEAVDAGLDAHLQMAARSLEAAVDTVITQGSKS